MQKHHDDVAAKRAKSGATGLSEMRQKGFNRERVSECGWWALSVVTSPVVLLKCTNVCGVMCFLHISVDFVSEEVSSKKVHV